MRRDLILLPAPEAEWADMPPEAHEADLRAACERWSSRGELLEIRRMAE